MLEARLHHRLGDIPAAQWDGLHDGRNPFVAHAFLAGMEQTGVVRPDWGWSPAHLALWQDNQLLAAAPGYLKDNSHGEFVFDHAWAHAYAQHGLDYFPKWLCAVPYSPVTGPRLLSRDPVHRSLLLEAMVGLADRKGWPSAHVNFHDEDEDAAFELASPGSPGHGEWLKRIDVQYHWHNRDGWSDFAGYLSAFDHKHRKNIRQERARVARAGVTFRVVEGADASAADIADIHQFYLCTFAEYGNHPTMTLEFVQHLAQAMPRSLVLFFAERDGRPIAGALCLRGGDTLYGRYWGATETVAGLHFETCYYQGIEYCLREGLTRFEPGAQGEHKLARGFMPTLVRSRHWIAQPEFRSALGDWCKQERAAIGRYATTLASRSPFKQPSGDNNGHADPPAPAVD